VTQHFDPTADSAAIAEATDSLLATANTLSDADVLAPSLLPGWSRGHVLTHLARNADSLVNRLTSAVTGVNIPQYPSPAARQAGIEAGAARPIGEQVRDLEESHRRFAAAVDTVPPAKWASDLRDTSGETRPASKILEARLREVAIHHLDLNAGYSASDWPSPFALRMLSSVVPAFEIRGIEPLTLLPDDIDARIDVSGGSALEIRGTTSALTTWLLGRDDGSALEVTGGQLPTPPAWT
jgi:maleylpyruvate isomerase